MGVEVRINLAGLRDAQRKLANFPRTPEGRQAFSDAATLYATAMDRRFGQQSRGGGEWPPLTEATILRRRMGKGGGTRGQAVRRAFRGLRRARTAEGIRKKAARVSKLTSMAGVSILQDTGTLRAGITVGFALDDIPNGVRYGFAGPHPKKGVTLAKLATWHHTGAGRLPVRRILVAPDELTQNRMAGVIRRAARRMLTGRA